MHAALVSRIMRRRPGRLAGENGRNLPQQAFERFAHLGDGLVRRPQVLTA
jgi:hypothetical protein